MRPCRAERRPAGGFGSVSVSGSVSPSRLWMWSLTLGCIAGSVCSSSSSTRYTENSVAPAVRPAASTSYAYSERDSHVLHSAPVSIYRSAASLRSGHGESLTPGLAPWSRAGYHKLTVSCLYQCISLILFCNFLYSWLLSHNPSISTHSQLAMFLLFSLDEHGWILRNMLSDSVMVWWCTLRNIGTKSSLYTSYIFYLV